jgi:hypothetical protein
LLLLLLLLPPHCLLLLCQFHCCRHSQQQQQMDCPPCSAAGLLAAISPQKHCLPRFVSDSHAARLPLIPRHSLADPQQQQQKQLEGNPTHSANFRAAG